MRNIRNNLARITRDRRKLTDAEVLAIRARHLAGEKQRDLALEFGVARSTLSGIIGRISWRGVP